MDTTKFLLGTLIGAAIFFLLGFLVYGMLLSSFFESHSVAPEGVHKESPDMIYMILSNLALGALITYIFQRWAGIKTASTGFIAGATICFLMAFFWNFMNYSMANIMDITAVLSDIVVFAILGGCVGAGVGWFLGRGD